LTDGLVAYYPFSGSASDESGNGHNGVVHGAEISSGTGVSDVLITFSNGGGTATTDSSGNYSITVPDGYTGTATPSKTGYTFSPATKSYSSLTANQTGQDYTATLAPAQPVVYPYWLVFFI